jgi:hypothetical protein
MGSSSTSNTSSPATTNTDRRLAVSSGQGVSGDNSNAIDNSISNSDEAIRYIASQGSDTVQALADAGTRIIRDSGGAVIELAKFQGAQNTEAFDTLVTRGTSLMDKLLDKSSEGFGLAAKVVESFTPTPNKEADNTKYLYIAGALVAGALLLKGTK